MENPVTTVKKALTPGKIAGWLFLGLAVFAIADFTGVTNWILYPVSTIKAKFFKPKA